MPPTLTRREREALVLVARGLTVKETAHRLGMAQGSVHNLLPEAYRRVDAPNAASAIWR